MGIRIKFEPELSISENGVPVGAFATRHARDLFCLLVHHRGESLERTALEDQFWPTVDRPRAQLSLRLALNHIHRVFSDSPISADRRTVRCLATRVTVLDHAGPMPLLEAPVKDANWLLSFYRREPVDRFIQFGQRYLDEHTLERSVEFRLRFYLAFAFHEINRTPLGLDMAKALLREANTRDEQLIAHHAYGGLLWHCGQFGEGFGHLWEAHSYSEAESGDRAHVLTNLAIGYFEAHKTEDLLHTAAMTEQTLRQQGMKEHDVALSYVRALSLVRSQEFHSARTELKYLLGHQVAQEHRLSVYLLEALADVEAHLQQNRAAQRCLAKAGRLRRTFNMQPSRVELARLRATDARIHA